jgi:hypothetical protein
MLSPEKTHPTPNTVFVPRIVAGMAIRDSQPIGRCDVLSLQPAYVDPQTGAWSVAGAAAALPPLQFGFNAQGEVVGLPTDLASLAPKILQLWALIEEIAGTYNGLRKVV